MKKILLVLLTFLSLATYSQNWKTIKENEVLTFSFPENYSVNDTLGMKVYSASDSSANYQCIITKSDFNNSTVQELEINYDKYLNGMQEQMPGFKLISKNFIDLEKSKIHALKTFFSGTVSGQNVDMENLSVFVKGNVFSFSTVVPKDQKGAFNSLINKLNFTATNADQINPAPSSGIGPETLGLIIGFAITGLALFFGIRYSNKKKKKKASDSVQK